MTYIVIILFVLNTICAYRTERNIRRILLINEEIYKIGYQPEIRRHDNEN